MDWDKTYWSAGKLLLTSEYVVIDGAEALAIPSRFGQSLKVNHNHSEVINWVSKTNEDQIWLSVEMDTRSLCILNSSDESKAERLCEILHAAKSMSSDFPVTGAAIETNLDFPQNWGLGSSSTLLCNIANWLNIDPFELHFAVSNGSGYDIACGISKTPLLYQVKDKNPKFRNVEFHPEFAENIFFIHLNRKQFSDQEVARYSELKTDIDLSEVTNTFSDLTQQILNATSLQEFEELIVEHENLMSHILQRETIRESLFQLYSGGVIKSLGAWGGDFVMVTARDKKDLEYFSNKGYDTIISFKDFSY